MFDLDMNRVFPGDNNGAMAEYVAAGIVEDIIGSDMCLDIHSSNIFVKFSPITSDIPSVPGEALYSRTTL